MIPETQPHDPDPDLHAQCRRLAQILDQIGSKWTVMIIGALSDGPMRFNALRRLIGGVSQRMLTLTLRDLVRDGLIVRTVHSTVPPQVAYALTAAGATLIGPLRALSEWAISHQDEVEAARAAYDAAQGGP